MEHVEIRDLVEVSSDLRAAFSGKRGAVVGAGLLGMTAAVKIAAAGARVRLFHRDPIAPERGVVVRNKPSSYVAAGVQAVFGCDDVDSVVERRFLTTRAFYGRLGTLHAERFGLVQQPLVIYSNSLERIAKPWIFGLPDYERVQSPVSGRPNAVQVTTFFVTPLSFMRALSIALSEADVSLQGRDVRGAMELAGEGFDFLVYAAGLGNAELAGDDELVAMSEFMLEVPKLPEDDTGYLCLDPDHVSFFLPRGGFGDEDPMALVGGNLHAEADIFEESYETAAALTTDVIRRIEAGLPPTVGRRVTSEAHGWRVIHGKWSGGARPLVEIARAGITPTLILGRAGSAGFAIGPGMAFEGVDLLGTALIHGLSGSERSLDPDDVIDLRRTPTASTGDAWV